VETIQEDKRVDTEPAPTPVATAPALPEPIATPIKTTGVRRSTRVRVQTKPGYTPSISGSSKYAYAVTQMECQGALHPDAHMFFNYKVCPEEPDAVAAIMTQLSLKAGLREWGDTAKGAARSEMKQLHFQDTFKPHHWSELTHAQKQSVLESHTHVSKTETQR
jgi:hypothetical protein